MATLETSGGGDAASDQSEPLLVGTNSKGDLTIDLNQSSSDSEPFVVGSNDTLKITVFGSADKSSSGSEPVVVGTNNKVTGAENVPSNGSAPLLVTTNSTVEFVYGGETSPSGTTPLVVDTNKTIGSEERITESNAPKNDANYQWELTSGGGAGSMPASGDSLTGGGGSMPAGGDSLTGGGDSTSGSGNADFFRNLFGAGQAPNPDYKYEFDSQQGNGNFMPGGVDSSSLMGSSSNSSDGGSAFGAGSSALGGFGNSNNSGDVPLTAGSNNTFL